MENRRPVVPPFPVVSIKGLQEKLLSITQKQDEILKDPEIKKISSKLTDAFTKCGFVYLIDHGIESSEAAFKASKEFFEKKSSFKSKYVRTSNESNWGYVPFKVETFDKNKPYDLKECFNFNYDGKDPIIQVDKELEENIADLDASATKLTQDCQYLAMALLKILSPIIADGNNDFLSDMHKGIGVMKHNVTTLRLLYYPSILHKSHLQDNQSRCGEHSDYGTITLLFQDDIGGLQVKSPSGKYVDAVPIPGSIVVNIGDLLERWTSGRFKSTRHRVLINDRHDKPRQSMAYFVHPDSDVEVSCLDGSDKFESVNSLHYLDKKFQDTYG